MTNNLLSYPESAGSRGFDVVFSKEDFDSHFIDNLMSVVENPANLIPANELEINFASYFVSGINRFGLFREFNVENDNKAEVFVQFRATNGVLDLVEIHISDPTNKDRTVVIRAELGQEEPYTIQDVHKSINSADEAYIKDVMLFVLLEHNELHSQDFTDNGLFEYFKLLHPGRTETHSYVHKRSVLLDGYINAEDINFAIAQSKTSLTLKRWFDGTHQLGDKPVKTEYDISTVTTMPIADSYTNGQGNLHMISTERSLIVSQDSSRAFTMDNATCSSRLKYEHNRSYGNKEAIVANNLETITAQNDAKSKERYMTNMWNSAKLFTKWFNN